MAMRTARLLAVLAAVAVLGSCQVLEVVFGSVFPATVALAKAQADLSGQITSNDGSAIRVRVVQSGTNGYVILIGNLQSGTVAYVYDLNLNLKATFPGLTTDGVMVDQNGAIIIGSLSVNASTLASAAAVDNLSSNGNTGGADGFFDNALIPNASLGIGSGSNVMTYSTYGNPWPAGGGTPHTAQLSSSQSNLRIDAILDDGNPAGNVTLAISQSNNGNGNGSTATCYFLTTAKSNYTAGGASLVSLLDSSPHLDNIATGCIGFAQGSIMAYDGSAGRFLKIDPATGSTQASFYNNGADMSNTRLGYAVGGGTFYGFDTKTRVLTKYAAWW
jgi:hypothetical protein